VTADFRLQILDCRFFNCERKRRNRKSEIYNLQSAIPAYFGHGYPFHPEVFHVMAHRVCPWWIGYLLASPVRCWLGQDPIKILSP
jgi:hypothetical protein